MFPSNSKILNNLKDHVDSGDVLFVVSGDASNNQQAIKALNERCKSKCPGRRKLDRNFHSKVVDASQFVAACKEAHCADTLSIKKSEDISMKNTTSEVISEKRSEGSVKKLRIENKPKRSDESNRIKIKSRGPPPSVDNDLKRKTILRQLKNHRVSSTSKAGDGSRQTLM